MVPDRTVLTNPLMRRFVRLEDQRGLLGKRLFCDEGHAECSKSHDLMVDNMSTIL